MAEIRLGSTYVPLWLLLLALVAIPIVLAALVVLFDNLMEMFL